jgi:nucleotide-binding universal stress UspA family protein
MKSLRTKIVGGICFFIFLSAQPSRADDAKKYGESKLREVDGIHLLQSRGSDYAIAYESSRLRGAQIVKGMVPYMGQHIEQMLTNALAMELPQAFINFLADSLFRWPLYKNLKERELDVIRGISKGVKDAGFDLKEDLVKKAYVAPEVVHLLVSTAVEMGLVPGVINTERFGCASVVVLPEVTGSQKSYFVRGQDYPGLGTFDRYPSVHLVKPDEGYKYVAINSLGLSSIPLTGVNEKGLAMAVHVTVTQDINADATMIFELLERIIRGASTIDEAVKIARDIDHVSGWQIHLSDVIDGVRHAAVLEISSLGVNLVKRQGSSVVTNHYYSSAQKKREIYMGKTLHMHNLVRDKRLAELVEQNRGRFDVKTGVAILRDHFDPLTRQWVSYSPNIISTVDQVKSVILELSSDPMDTRVWMASGEAPTSQGAFVPFDLKPFFEKSESAEVPADRMAAVSERREPTTGRLLKGYADYKRAFVEVENNFGKNFETVIPWLVKAAESDQSDWYWFAAAMLKLKAKQFDESLAIFRKIENSSGLDAHRKDQIQLYMGAIHDILGESDEADKHYKQAGSGKDVDPFLAKAAEHWMEEGFSESKAESMNFSMKWLDVFGYGM